VPKGKEVNIPLAGCGHCGNTNEVRDAGCDDNLRNMMMTSSGVKLHCFKDSFSPLVVCAFCRG
jgi:hypothetical protein